MLGNWMLCFAVDVMNPYTGNQTPSMEILCLRLPKTVSKGHLKIICQGIFVTKMTVLYCTKRNNENRIKLSELIVEISEYVRSASFIFMRSSMMS